MAPTSPIINGEDFRSYEYYRTRYGFDIGVDEKITPTMTAYLKGLFSDFHDYGETHVYTPNSANMISAATKDTVTFFTPAECAAYNAANPPSPGQSPPCSPGNWDYRHYIRRPDQQVFSFLTGARHDLSKDVIRLDFAISRGHNIGGQAFPTTNFSGGPIPAARTTLARWRLWTTRAIPIGRISRRPTEPTALTPAVTPSAIRVYQYHATQLNVQGSASLAHNYTVHGHPSTFSLGVKIRNSYSTQYENPL